jgi:competence protein ComEC
VLDAGAFPEDCSRAELVVTALTAPRDCGALTIDAARLSAFGAHAVRIDGEPGRYSFDIETERTAFPRPWQAGGGEGPADSPKVSTSATGP